MIAVQQADEPLTFHSNVREPGIRAIAELVGEKPKRAAGRQFSKIASRREEIPVSALPDYWVKCLDDLLKAYDRICAYSCFRIHEVTGAASVDHFAPKSRRWDKIYEWTNYRLACSRMNARKNSFEDLVDPFEIGDDWFQLELVGFTVFPNPDLDAQLQSQIQTTIERLRLNDFREDRARDAEDFWAGDISFALLQRESPFVARELVRHNRLRT